MAKKVEELEGTWEEIRAHDAELAGKQVKLKVIEGAASETDNQQDPIFSTLGSLLKHAGSWVGSDLEECLQAVYDNRTPARF